MLSVWPCGLIVDGAGRDAALFVMDRSRSAADSSFGRGWFRNGGGPARNFALTAHFAGECLPASREMEDSMKSLAMKVQRFLVAEDGPTAVEYAVMLALIVIVCITAIRSIGTNANLTFEAVGTELGS